MNVVKTVYLSLCFHIALMILLSIVKLPENKTQSTVEFTVLENPKANKNNQKDNRQIVRQPLVPEKLITEKTEDPLSFLSEKSQKVLKQSQALLKGMTANRGNKVSAQKDIKESQEQKTKEKSAQVADTKSTDINTIYSGKKSLNQIAKEQLNFPNEYNFGVNGVSTSGEMLPNEVSVGSFTSLNTDRYLFYSFYSRVEELIRFRWESMVKYTMDTTSPNILKRNLKNRWTTEVEIWLKPNGEYHSAHLMKESGIKNLDAAASTAFQQARLFPNPPREMIETDGLIHLKYSFTVQWDPRIMVQQ